jgi:hypothetical protein
MPLSVYVVDKYVYSLVARERIYQFAPSLACLPLENRKRFCIDQNSEGVLSSSSGEVGFCSSVTKFDGRTKQGRKRFVSTMKLQDKGYNPENSVLGSIPGEDGFCISVTKHDRRTKPRRKLFVPAGRLQKQRLQPQASPGFESRWRWVKE